MSAMAATDPRRRALVICPVLPVPPASGGQKRTLRLLEAMERAGLVPHVLSTDPGEGGAAESLRSRGWVLDVLGDPAGTLANRARQLAAGLPSPHLAQVERRVAELVAEGCALVQVEHIQSAYYERAFGGKPWVLSLHNVDSQLMAGVARSEPPLTLARLRARNRARTMRRVERRAVPAAEAVLCVSEPDRERLATLSDRVVLAPNGIDEHFFDVPAAPLPADRVLFFGRLDYPPNRHGLVRFLTEAWPAVRARRPGARLRVVGGGMDDDLRARIEAAPAAEPVGLVDDLGAELAATRCVVVPLWAGGGTRLKVLEALAAARPVAGTALGVEGLGFEDSRHGLVADTPSGLAVATSTLLTDEGRATALAAEGRRLAEGRRWRSTLEPAVQVYNELLERADPDRTSVQS